MNGLQGHTFLECINLTENDVGISITCINVYEECYCSDNGLKGD